MSNGNYDALLLDFCALAGVSDPSAICESGNVTVNNVAFTLMPCPAIDPQIIQIYCDFGATTEGKEVEIYRSLLEINLLISPHASFALNAENGHALLNFKIDLMDATAQTLLNSLKLSAEEALLWRATHYQGINGHDDNRDEVKHFDHVRAAQLMDQLMRS